jgi:hypothetical protein
LAERGAQRERVRTEQGMREERATRWALNYKLLLFIMEI